MDSFHAVFLYFSCMTVVASRVLPPTNVTLHCRNFHNVLKWSYPEDTTGLLFRLDIGAYQNPPDIRTWNTPALQADLSFLSDPNDSYYVTVTAVVNGSESEPAPSEDGITFSYFHENPVETKCYLDLPPVNVTAQRDNKVLISFDNPSVFHCQKMKKKKKNVSKTMAAWILPLKSRSSIRPTHLPVKKECVRTHCQWMQHNRNTV